GGGLVGENDGTVTETYALGNVSGNNGIGGLVGDGSATKSYARGNVSITGVNPSQAGGLVGQAWAPVTNCYSTGKVTAASGSVDVGGLIGQIVSTILTRSYATGAVSASGSTDVGGLVGESSSGVYTGDSYWNNEVNSSLNGIGNTS